MRAKKIEISIGFAGYSGVPGKENEGFTANAGFVITGEGVVVFDALGTPSLGVAMVDKIRELTMSTCQRSLRPKRLTPIAFTFHARVNLFTELISSPFQINSKCALWTILRTCLGVKSPQHVAPGFLTE